MNSLLMSGLREEELSSHEGYYEDYVRFLTPPADFEGDVLEEESLDLLEDLVEEPETDGLKNGFFLEELAHEQVSYHALFEEDEEELSYLPVSEEYDDGYEVEFEADFDEDWFDPDVQTNQKDSVMYFLQLKTNPSVMARCLYNPDDEEETGARGMYVTALLGPLS